MTSDFAAAMRRAAEYTRALKVGDATRVIQAALMGRLSFGTGNVVSDEPESSVPRFIEAPAAPANSNMVGDPASATGIFLTRSFVCAAGARDYKLYIPASGGDRPRGLIVMLHGCKQNPDDFAAGTNMNVIAEAHGLLVAYPGQNCAANAASCWNWFEPRDQQRDAGEPSIIAGITRALMAEFGIDRDRVFIAGLSAGGAMAAVMGETYPDLYAAVGIHSGVAYGAAKDVMSAFAAMRGVSHFSAPVPQAKALRAGPAVRMIVFQGSADHTVDASNAARIVAAAGVGDDAEQRQDTGRSIGGRTYTRTTLAGTGGDSEVEYWLVDGAGHAWSGGKAAGSFTDPQGPDASVDSFSPSRPSATRPDAFR
jgi:poly(hydroxyalkanoate) depolymerase family esterase